MADYCRRENVQELDDVHRLLPPEIRKDIGITNNSDDLRRAAIVEELASRLATVLGDTRSQHHHHHHLSPAWATNSDQHHHHRAPQPRAYRPDGRGRIAHGHANAQRQRVDALINARMLDMAITLPTRFAPARPRQVDAVLPPPERQGSRGTGVFLPRAQAHRHTTRGARPPRTGCVNDMKPRRGEQQCRQMQGQQLQLHAHHAVVAAGAALEQQARKRSDAANAASHGYCCHDELGLPQEWIY